MKEEKRFQQEQSYFLEKKKHTTKQTKPQTKKTQTTKPNDNQINENKKQQQLLGRTDRMITWSPSALIQAIELITVKYLRQH